MVDELVELAMHIQRKMVALETPIILNANKLRRLTPYEFGVLARTAEKKQYVQLRRADDPTIEFRQRHCRIGRITLKETA